MTTTVDHLLSESRLPRPEALMLLAHATGATRERLIAGSRDVLEAAVADAFRALAARRVDGEPIAYLVGSRAFYGRSFACDARALIPRPETELLVDLALARIDDNDTDAAIRVVDLGTGSGVLAITIALERPAVDVVATDRSKDALALARTNADRLGARIAFASGDWFAAAASDAAYDVIVSNPPYIAHDDVHLREGDLRFEPRGALTDDADGFVAIRHIVAGARSHLRARGSLLIEHGHTQAADVRRLFASAGFDGVESLRDLAGIERVTVGRARAEASCCIDVEDL